MADKLRFRPTGMMRHYDVLLGDRFIGTVQHVERRFNLRRVYVVQGWRATLPNGHKLVLQGSDYSITASTRKTAAEALRLHWLHAPTSEIEKLLGGRV